MNDDEYQAKFEKFLAVLLLVLVLLGAMFVANHSTANNCQGMEDACQEVTH